LPSGRDIQRRCDLKDEDGIAVTLCIEREITGAYFESGCRFVETRTEGGSSDISGNTDRSQCTTGKVVVGNSGAFCASSVSVFAVWIAPPVTTPGPNPVTADPGLTPTFPVILVWPIFVTVDPARTAKADAPPKATGDWLALVAVELDEEFMEVMDDETLERELDEGCREDAADAEVRTDERLILDEDEERIGRFLPI
jgi:hypothetical protein